MADEIVTTKKKGGPRTQAALYSIVSSHFDEIMDVLAKMLTSKNEAIRLGTAKILLNKILPDLKAVEIGGVIGEDGSKSAIQLFINTGNGFVPAIVRPPATPAGSSLAESETVQSADLASESTENNNSDIRDGEAGASS